jgi:hypothetical protein
MIQRVFLIDSAPMIANSSVEGGIDASASGFDLRVVACGGGSAAESDECADRRNATARSRPVEEAVPVSSPEPDRLSDSGRCLTDALGDRLRSAEVPALLGAQPPARVFDLALHRFCLSHLPRSLPPSLLAGSRPFRRCDFSGNPTLSDARGNHNSSIFVRIRTNRRSGIRPGLRAQTSR